MEMHNRGKINWLASYPKSGNTWVRVFLANLLSGTENPVDINELSHLTIASNRQLFDEYSAIASTDLNNTEIERLRPSIYEALSGCSDDNRYLKIHDAFVFTSEGKALVSETASNKALYIIRNPLDVAVSFAHHLHVGCDKTVEIMCNKKYAFCDKTDKLPKQLEQKLLTWSGHVESWTKQKQIPLLVVRYEDLLEHTEATFKKIVVFFEIKTSREKFDRSLNNSTFNSLQKQENEKGFREKAPKAVVFFRKGVAGAWENELSPELVQKIIDMHKEVMVRYGYETQCAS